jgi:hypothetical protein
MNPFLTVSLITGIPAALGPGLDRFLRDKDKGRLHHQLLRAWVYLDETTLPDVSKAMASWAVSVYRRVFGSRWFSFRVIILSFILSATTSIAALIIGEQLVPKEVYPTLPQFLLGVVFLVPINYPFDFLSVLMTRRILELIVSSRPSIRLLAISLDIGVLFLLALLPCMIIWLLTALSKFYLPYSYIDWPGTLLRMFRGGLRILGTPITGHVGMKDDKAVALYALSIFIPFSLYLAILGIAIVAKGLLRVLKWFVMYFLERATEVRDPKELMVFTLTGWLFSATTLLLTVSINIAKAFSR